MINIEKYIEKAHIKKIQLKERQIIPHPGHKTNK